MRPRIAAKLGSAVIERIPIGSRIGPTAAGRSLVCGVVLAPVSVPLAIFASLTAALQGWVATRRELRSSASAKLSALVIFSDMIRVGVLGGASIRHSLSIASEFAPTTVSQDLHLARLRVTLARSVPIDVALREWSGTVGRPAEELSALLRSADVSGAEIGATLGRFVVDLRRRRRRDLEERARRLPVTQLVPLVCCVLPAFVLLTAVPMVVVGFQQIGAAP